VNQAFDLADLVAYAAAGMFNVSDKAHAERG
jgi:hypothetical protein